MAEKNESVMPHDQDLGADTAERDAPAVDLDQKLLDAAEQGQLEDVKDLLTRHAAITAKRSNLETPLHLAARFGNKAVVNELLKYHPNINCQDSDGWTALYGAAEGGEDGVVKVLLNTRSVPPSSDVRGAGVQKAQHTVETKSIETDKGAASDRTNRVNVDLPDHMGQTPLHIASYYGFERVVQAILEYKAKPDIPDDEKRLDKADRDGWTALYAAAM